MALEIEHKYFVTDTSFRETAVSDIKIRQGYLSVNPERVVRVRTFGKRAYITIKGLTDGDTRQEFEYEIPIADAEEILGMCVSVLEKRRWMVPFGGHIWEVDEFQGALQGLVLAEIELPSGDTEYSVPPFIGKNVTGDPRYFNSVLSTQRPDEVLDV